MGLWQWRGGGPLLTSWWAAKREREGAVSNGPFEGTPPVTYLPTPRPHLPIVLQAGDQASSMWALGDTCHTIMKCLHFGKFFYYLGIHLTNPYFSLLTARHCSRCFGVGTMMGSASGLRPEFKSNSGSYQLCGLGQITNLCASQCPHSQTWSNKVYHKGVIGIR